MPACACSFNTCAKKAAAPLLEFLILLLILFFALEED